MEKFEYFGKYPDAKGMYGKFGGQVVPKPLLPALKELEEAYFKHKDTKEFKEQMEDMRKHYMGRPTPIYLASHLSSKYKCKIYLKREDLLHGGAHKLNNTMGQALLAKMMGKTKLIAETGAGQHGFATAIAGAYFNMDTKIFMGTVDIERQKFNVNRIKMLGAEVIPVERGSNTLKDAVDEAIEYWVGNVDDTHYLLGSAVGPHPYPLMVRNFQRVIGDESFEQMKEEEGRLPTHLVACVGGGSNAIGSFYRYLEHKEIDIWAVEAAGLGEETEKHALALGKGVETDFQGAHQYCLQDDEGKVKESYSIAAGLDYPGVGPELCHLASVHRLKKGSVTDQEAVDAILELGKSEGILPAVESSHAVAFALKLAETLTEDDIILVNLSGHGGKDIERVLERLEL